MMRCKHGSAANVVDIKETTNKYYLSVKVSNKTGVIGKLGLVFAENGISLASLLQKGVSEDNTATIVIITELCREKDVLKAIEDLKKEGCINELNSMIRVANDDV